MGGKGRRAASASGKLRFPEERRLPWLTPLLEAYATVDAGVAAGVRERARRGERPACREGCDVCCRTQRDIAVFPLELTGISWYATERVKAPARDTLRARLQAHTPGGPCPFLDGGSCAVYPVRPMACRLFTVFGRPCAEDEDPWHTRRAELLVPARATLEAAQRALLPFHGVVERADQEHWLAQRLLETLVRSLPELEWAGLARMMEEFGRPGPLGGP